MDLFSINLSVQTPKCWFWASGENLIFFERLDTTCVRPKCSWNAVLVLFGYINLVIFRKSSKFSKWSFRHRFGCFAPKKPKNLQSNPPPLAQNPAIDPSPSWGKIPLYQVFQRSKGLGRGLMHPCLTLCAVLSKCNNKNRILFQLRQFEWVTEKFQRRCC